MVAVREIGFQDLEAAAVLTRSAGWGASRREDWERLWLGNPAVRPGDPPLARGWVLEEKDRVVGMALSIAQAYRLARRRLRASIFAGLVVAPEARGSTMKLVSSYVRQGGVDLLLSPASAPETVALLNFFKLTRMPQPGYDVTCYWVTHPVRFLAAGLRKKGVPRALALAAGLAGAPLLRAEGGLRRRGPRATGEKRIRILETHEIDASFDELWERKVAERPVLLAERTAETLRWHFSRPVPDAPFLVGAYRGERLEGYAAVVRQDAPLLGLRRARVADLIVAGDDPSTIRQLLGAAVNEAAARGADMVELVGFPGHVRDVARESRPFTLSAAAWPFQYRATDADLHRELGAPERWHASLRR